MQGAQALGVAHRRIAQSLRRRPSRGRS